MMTNAEAFKYYLGRTDPNTNGSRVWVGDDPHWPDEGFLAIEGLAHRLNMVIDIETKAQASYFSLVSVYFDDDSDLTLEIRTDDGWLEVCIVTAMRLRHVIAYLENEVRSQLMTIKELESEIAELEKLEV